MHTDFALKCISSPSQTSFISKEIGTATKAQSWYFEHWTKPLEIRCSFSPAKHWNWNVQSSQLQWQNESILLCQTTTCCSEFQIFPFIVVKRFHDFAKAWDKDEFYVDEKCRLPFLWLLDYSTIVIKLNVRFYKNHGFMYIPATFHQIFLKSYSQLCSIISNILLTYRLLCHYIASTWPHKNEYFRNVTKITSNIYLVFVNPEEKTCPKSLSSHIKQHIK